MYQTDSLRMARIFMHMMLIIAPNGDVLYSYSLVMLVELLIKTHHKFICELNYFVFNRKGDDKTLVVWYPDRYTKTESVRESDS